MIIIRRGKEYSVGEDIYNYPASEKDSPEYKIPEIGPYQLLKLYPFLYKKFIALHRKVIKKLNSSINRYKTFVPGLEWDKKLIEFGQKFDQYLNDIQSFLSMIAQGVSRAEELGKPVQFSNVEVSSIKDLRQKISSDFKSLINDAKGLLEEGRGTEKFDEVDQGQKTEGKPELQAKGPVGYEAALALQEYINIISDPENESLSRIYKTGFPIPMMNSREETIPLYDDFYINKAALDSLFEQAKLPSLAGDLATAWTVRISSIASIFKTNLNSFRSFVRSSYKNYVFWKYADKYIEKIKKLDSSDQFIFNAQLRELLQKDSSIDDILYRDLFISLLGKFIENNDRK